MDNELLSELMTCGICMETLTEPHQYPCGHSYCLACMADLRSRGEYRCPECRKEFPADSDVIKNYRLAHIVDAYQRPGFSQVISDAKHIHLAAAFGCPIIEVWVYT